MTMSGSTICAIAGCGLPLSENNNLCDQHKLPGKPVRVGENTMIVTVWHAEHNGEAGYILLNDWAMGAHFGGRAGFEAMLAAQGFVNVRNLATPDELDTPSFSAISPNC